MNCFLLFLSTITIANAYFSGKENQTIIQLGDEIDQIDFTITPDKMYSIELNQNDKICNRADGFNCTIVVAVTKMMCYLSNGNQYLEIVQDYGNGHTVTDQKCVNFEYVEYGENIYFQSTDKILLRSFGVPNIRFTATLVLNSSTEINYYCPDEYIECHDSNHDATTCIRDGLGCDKRPNCPSFWSPDEYDCNKCDNDCWEDSRYTIGFSWLEFIFIFACIIVILTVAIFVRRYFFTQKTRPRTVVGEMSTSPTPNFDPVKFQA